MRGCRRFPCNPRPPEHKSGLERFNFEKGETRRRRHSAARPKVSGKTAFFPRNDRPYGLKRAAFQTEKALTRCLCCGRIGDIMTPLPTPAVSGMHVPGFSEIRSARIEFDGICDQCASARLVAND